MSIFFSLLAATLANVNDTFEPPLTFDETELDQADMQRLLHWAIEHSDPDKLDSMAAQHDEWRAHLNDAEWLKQKRQELHDTMAFLNQDRPSEGDLMVEAITILRDASSSASLRHRALVQLAMLVEPLDNANDLPKLNHALDAILHVLDDKGEWMNQDDDDDDNNVSLADLQCAAADVIRTAASNNPIFTHALITARPDVIPLLTTLLQSSPLPNQVAVRCLGALSNLLRMDETARTIFFETNGLDLLETLLMVGHTPVDGDGERDDRITMRALALLTDLASMLSRHEPFLSRRVLARLGQTMLHLATRAAHDARLVENEWRGSELLERSLRALVAWLEYKHMACEAIPATSPLLLEMKRVRSEGEAARAADVYVDDVLEAVNELAIAIKCGRGGKEL